MNAATPSTKAATRKLPGHDIFCTPENSDFVSQVPYQSLSTTEREIRLLKILPDSGSGFVECELLPTVKLADVEKQYLALSYCAGSARNTRPIKVNGSGCNVFANLHHALTEARHYWQTHADQQDLLLWVDQICINQFDLAERSHQVGFMRDIYEKSRHTLICLSTPEAHGEDMRWLVMRRLDLELERVSWRHFYSDHHKTELGFEELWAASLGVAKSPWWTRAWVFQEFIVSTQATFLYGRHSMSYLDFAILTAGIPGPETPPPGFIVVTLNSHFQKEKTESTMSKMRGFLIAKLKQSRTTDLKVLLSCTKNCQATDKRDKIYSILGLAEPGYGIVPDYSGNIAINDLVVETTKKIILFEDSLMVLSYLDRDKIFYRYPRGTLPSWAIDWTDSASFGLRSSISVVSDYAFPRFVSYQPDGITQSSLDAVFMKLPHPQYPPNTQITAIQVWAVLLDDGFYKNGDSWYTFQGSRGFVIRGWDWDGLEVNSDYELWAVRGTIEPFLLCKYSYGYRIVRPVYCGNLARKLLPPDDQHRAEFYDGTFDMSKMEQTRIILF
ncbi:hypothetical protein HG531_000041 [Fusarium graminearum]|nr:hypothetical protein HG531_000041 [Fusarium graminearum]